MRRTGCVGKSSSSEAYSRGSSRSVRTFNHMSTTAMRTQTRMRVKRQSKNMKNSVNGVSRARRNLASELETKLEELAAGIASDEKDLAVDGQNFPPKKKARDRKDNNKNYAFRKVVFEIFRIFFSRNRILGRK